MERRMPSLGMAIGLLAALAAAPPVAAQIGPPPLFAPAAELAPAERPSVAAVEWSRVRVAAEALEAQALALELAPGVRHLARVESVERRGPGDLAWRGRLEGHPDSHLTLTLKGGYVVGLIYAPEGVFELGTQPDGGQVLVRLAQERFAPCAGGVVAEARAGSGLATEGGEAAPSAALRAALASRDAVDEIQVMSLYTPQARDAAGGVAAIEATIQAAVDATNTAFANSDMPARYNLVYAGLANRNDSGNLFSDLPWLRSDAGVAALRDTWAADLVSLIVNNGGGFCGLGYVIGSGVNPANFGPNAFQVTARGCAVGNLTYAHEHGHNLGMDHNPEDGADPQDALHPWAFGHYHVGSYRTVMSYADPCAPTGCTRHPYFSNPDVSFMGLPTGIADQRDNHRTGNLTTPFAANWRQGVEIFTDGFESGDLSAWEITVP